MHISIFRQLKREDEAAEATQALSQGPKLDLGFKEGQTIKININVSFIKKKKKLSASNIG